MGKKAIKVVQGQVWVHLIKQIVDRPDCKVYSMDCRAKHPAFMISGSDDGPYEVHLCTDEGRTTNYEASEVTTIVKFHHGPSWSCHVVASRYTVRVFFYKEKTGKLVWQEETEPPVRES